MNAKVWFFCFRPEISFLRKFGPKNQNCQFTLKLGTKTNLNMQDLMVCSLFLLSTEIPFWGKFGQKNRNFHLKLKSGTYSQNKIFSKSKKTNAKLDRTRNSDIYFYISFDRYCQKNFCRGDWTLDCVSTKFWDFCFIS